MFHIIVLITESLSLAKSYPINDGSMIQLIRNDCILLIEQRLEDPAIGIESCSIKNSIFSAQELGNLCFQFLVNILCSADKPHRRHTITMTVYGLLCSFNNLRMRRQSQIIIRTKINDFLSCTDANIRTLWACNDSFIFVETSFFDPC